MDTINLSIDFVKASSATSAQTADCFNQFWAILVFGILSLGFLFFVFYRNKSLELNLSSAKHAKAPSTPYYFIFNSRFYKYLIIVVSILFSLSIIGVFFGKHAFAGNASSLEPDTNKITAYVFDDGTVSFSSCNLINIDDVNYSVEKSKVSVSDEAKSVIGLQSSNFAIYGFDGVVYYGRPDGSDYEVKDLSGLKPNESTEIGFNLEGLDKQSLYSLIGKNVFSINLTPINTHSVNFNVLGHGTTPHSYDFVGHNKTIAPPKNPEEIGWSFLAWYKEQTCTNLWDFDTDVVDENKTLYAKWKANYYTITYNTNGRGTVTPATTQVLFDSPYGNLAIPSCDGYTFNGWYYDSDCSEGNLVTSATLVKVASDHELYAKWTPNTYNVTFNKNGHGSDPVPTWKPVIFDDVYGELPILEEEGYSFGGWYLDEICSQSKFVDSETVVKTAGSHNLYAKWIANKYSVCFDKQGHGQDSENITVTFDSTYGTLPVLTESGFTFGGWFLDSACSQDKEVISTTIVTISDNHTLYAKWSGNKYTVTFDKNGHGVDPDPISMEVIFGNTYGELPVLSANGYTFKGWYLDSSCSEGKEVSKNTVVSTASDHSIYAKWEIIYYSITWETDGGSSVTGGSTSYTIEDISINIPAIPPTKTNWHFTGWLAIGANNWPGDEFKEAPILNNAYGDVTLKAQWGQLYFGISEDTNDKTLYLSGIKTEHATTMNNEALSATEDSSCGWSSLRSEINAVLIENEVKPDSTDFWFYNLTSCSSINLENLKSINVTSIRHMFDGCSQLASLDVSSIDTSKVTSMEYMFNGCSLIKTLDLEEFNTNRALNMTDMFSGCSKLETIYASDNFNTANVDPATKMFDGDSSLKGWLGTKFDINHSDVSYAIIDGDLDKPGYFSSKCTLFYQVCAYGLGQDECYEGGTEKAAITFGPAIGSSTSCLDVNGNHEHCIHNDSWFEIIKNCKDGHADWYSSCISKGCTKSIPIILNSTIGSMPSSNIKLSVLGGEKNGGKVNKTYLEWNNHGAAFDASQEVSNWATCKMRSTLNGYDNAWQPFSPSEYAGDNNLDSTNCLLSCFPHVITEAIKPKYYKVPTQWVESKIDEERGRLISSTTVLDKLWLFSGEEVFAQKGIDPWQKEYNKAQYTKNKSFAWNTFNNENIGFSFSGATIGRWLRSPYRYGVNFSNDGGFIIGVQPYHGEYGYYAIVQGINEIGISPGFCF